MMIASNGLLAIFVGLCCLFFSKWLSRLAVTSQNMVWGMHLGERERKGFRITFIVVGLTLVVLGCLNMFGLIPAKSG